MRTKKVKHTRANYSNPNEGVTINVNDVTNFFGESVSNGDDFVVFYKGGGKAVATASRNGRTLYIAAQNFPKALRKPSRTQRAIFHEVSAIVRL